MAPPDARENRLPPGYGSARKMAPKRYATVNLGSSEVVRSSSGYRRSYRFDALGWSRSPP